MNDTKCGGKRTGARHTVRAYNIDTIVYGGRLLLRPSEDYGTGQGHRGKDGGELEHVESK
jgi:hypothetical protein